MTFGARVVDFAQKPLGVVWLRDYHAGCTRERGCSIRGFEAGATRGAIGFGHFGLELFGVQCELAKNQKNNLTKQNSTIMVVIVMFTVIS